MKYVIFILSILLLTIIGCKSTKKSRSQRVLVNNDWVNPIIEPVFHPGIEAIFKENMDEEASSIDREGLIDFCSRMNTLFACSHLNMQEADSIYLQLYNSGILFNEPTGMPDPEEVRNAESFEIFRKRIAIHKNEDQAYSLFFVKTGCGYTYFYGQFNIPESDKKLNLKPLEVWRASMPC